MGFTRYLQPLCKASTDACTNTSSTGMQTLDPRGATEELLPPVIIITTVIVMMIVRIIEIYS